MLLPSIFRDNFVDSFFDDMFTTPSVSFKNAGVTQMNTDVQEYDDHYELAVELPGYSKEDITADVKDGYLTISASKTESKDEKDKKGKYIRRERYSGQCQRSFYIGDQVTHEDIVASFKDGILALSIPKKEAQPKVEEKKFVQIN